MALYHLTVSQIRRSAGQSAIAAAAYRAGECLYSDYYGEYSDYTRKGGVICSEILLPPPCPAGIPGPGDLVEYGGTSRETQESAACLQL